MYHTSRCTHLALTLVTMHLSRKDPGISLLDALLLGEYVVVPLYIFIGVVRGAILSPAYGVVLTDSFGVALINDSRD